MKILYRKNYMEELLSLKNKPDIKIITGIRRVGKSFLLNQLANYIENNEKNTNIVRINFNLNKFSVLTDYNELYKYVYQNYKKNMNNYLFIDEIQMCKNFELVINDLYDMQMYDIYITGSNAFMLSGDLATLFSGRYLNIEVFPFSFKEYIEYFNFENKNLAFDKYLLEGGFAGSYVYDSEATKLKYFTNLIDSVVVKDIITKNNITNPAYINEILLFLLDNISNITSLNNITNRINNEKIKIDYKTIVNYINYLCSGYVFYKVKRYDVKGSSYLKTNEKYYVIDHALRFAKLGKKYFDYGRLYENVVAIELLRRGYEIYVGKIYDKEVDFIAIKNGLRIYIQVADDISGEDVLKRELFPLEQIRDNYPKMIITKTNQHNYDIRGIKVKNIINWLLDEEQSV